MNWYHVPDWDNYIPTPGDVIRVGNYYRLADGTALDHPIFEPGVTPEGWRLGVDEPKTVTLTEFLLARIAEDEAQFNAEAHEKLGPSLGSGPWCHLPRPLAECEAKRRVIALHTHDGIKCAECRSWDAACPTLRALALGYFDHADYDETWRPGLPTLLL